MKFVNFNLLSQKWYDLSIHHLLSILFHACYIYTICGKVMQFMAAVMSQHLVFLFFKHQPQVQLNLILLRRQLSETRIE